MLESIKAELEANPRLEMDYPAITGEGRIWQEGGNRNPQQNQAPSLRIWQAYARFTPRPPPPRPCFA